MNTTTSRGANAAVLAVLRSALVRALQWRLWLLFAAASLLCALLAALPAWNWLAGTLNHSVQADAIAAGKAPALLLDALMSRDAPHGVIGESVSIAALLMLLLSPLLAGATVAAARSRTRLGFGDLLRGAITEYGPMLRMLLWSIVPIGFALLVMTMIVGGNEKAHEHAIRASELDTGRNIDAGFGVPAIATVLTAVEALDGADWGLSAQ